MRVRHSLLVVVVAGLILGACASGARRPANVPQPDLDAYLTHEIFFGSLGNAPASIEVLVTNRAAVPITVRRIEIDSPGMGQYGLYRTQQHFNQTIAPGETKPIGMVVQAWTTVSRPTEPLQIRAFVEIEAEGTRWRELLLARQ